MNNVSYLVVVVVVGGGGVVVMSCLYSAVSLVESLSFQ